MAVGKVQQVYIPNRKSWRECLEKNHTLEKRWKPFSLNIFLFLVYYKCKGVVFLANEKNGTTFAYKVVNNSQSGGAIYGLGIIGALIYFLQRADTFWAVLLGIAKAIFWPAVILYKTLELLNL